MLKVAFVLGCLLSLTLTQPMGMARKRLVRSSSESNSGSGVINIFICGLQEANQQLNNQQLQLLIQLLLASLATTTTTTAATTPAPATTG
ncbi:OTU domain-containing protein 5 [Sarotherodon galilaeus]